MDSLRVGARQRPNNAFKNTPAAANRDDDNNAVNNGTFSQEPKQVRARIKAEKNRRQEEAERAHSNILERVRISRRQRDPMFTSGQSVEEQIRIKTEGKSTDMLRRIFYMESVAEALRRGGRTMSYYDLSNDYYTKKILGYDETLRKEDKDELKSIYDLITKKEKREQLPEVESIKDMTSEFWIGYIDENFTEERLIASIKSKMNEYEKRHYE